MSLLAKDSALVRALVIEDESGLEKALQNVKNVAAQSLVGETSFRSRKSRTHLSHELVDLAEPIPQKLVLLSSSVDIVDGLSDSIDAVAVGGPREDRLELIPRSLESRIGRLVGGVSRGGGSEGGGVTFVGREEVEEGIHGLENV